MNRKILGLLAWVLLVAPVASQAQTLKFFGSVSGTSASLVKDTIGEVDDLPLRSFSVVGSVTGSIILDASSGTATYDFTFNEQIGGGPGTPALNNFSLSGGFYGGAGYYSGPEGTIQITTNAQGVITGATVDLQSFIYNGPQSLLTIGPTSIDGYFEGIIPGTYWGCPAAELSHIGPNGYGIYTGGTIKNCNVGVGSATPGHWIVERASADASASP